MRASTLFGLTIAILIGMAVVVGVKSAGLFDRKVPVIVNQTRPMVLVAKRNLFETLTTSSDDVMLRPVDDSEMDQYIRNKHKYMPPIPEAAHLRILARSVGANEPLLKEYFKDLEIPGGFNVTIRPGMRAVNLLVPRERAGGGIIRKDDKVDVYLTTTVCLDAACTQSMTASAPIALNLKVIVKRDSIWQRMQPLEDGKPIPFTLEANPYRAALIEFAKNKGYLTLVPTGPDETKKPVAVLSEGKDEEQRVIELLRGQPITDADLEEIFKLAPMAPPAQAQRPLQIEIYSGHRATHMVTFPNPAQNQAVNGAGGGAGESELASGSSYRSGRLGYRFVAPGTSSSNFSGTTASSSKPGECKTCRKK